MDKFIIRQRFHNQHIKITLLNGDVFYGVIIRDEKDFCLFVKNLDFKEFQETKSESLIKRIKISDIKSIDYQIK